MRQLHSTTSTPFPLFDFWLIQFTEQWFAKFPKLLILHFEVKQITICLTYWSLFYTLNLNCIWLAIKFQIDLICIWSMTNRFHIYSKIKQTYLPTFLKSIFRFSNFDTCTFSINLSNFAILSNSDIYLDFYNPSHNFRIPAIKHSLPGWWFSARPRSPSWDPWSPVCNGPPSFWHLSPVSVAGCSGFYNSNTTVNLGYSALQKHNSKAWLYSSWLYDFFSKHTLNKENAWNERHMFNGCYIRQE